MLFIIIYSIKFLNNKLGILILIFNEIWVNDIIFILLVLF